MSSSPLRRSGITVLPSTHTFICKLTEPYLPSLPSHTSSSHFCQYTFSVPLRVEGWVGLTDWSQPKWYTRPQTVTHPSTTQAWHRVTSLIETNALPRSQAATCWRVKSIEGTRCTDASQGTSTAESHPVLIHQPTPDGSDATAFMSALQRYAYCPTWHIIGHFGQQSFQCQSIAPIRTGWTKEASVGGNG